MRRLVRSIEYLSKKMGRKMIIATILLGVVLMIAGTYLVANNTSNVKVYTIGGILSIIGFVPTAIGVGVAFTQRFKDMSESSKRSIALLIIIALILACILLLVWLH